MFRFLLNLRFIYLNKLTLQLTEALSRCYEKCLLTLNLLTPTIVDAHISP